MITLLHPSRGRPEQAEQTIDNWVVKSRYPHLIESILSLDYSDPECDKYDRHAWGASSISHNQSVVEATNEAAKLALGNILVYLSDDFDCPINWDELILSKLDRKKPQLLKVDDCLQPFDVAVLTIPIMTYPLYKKLGYFWHPDYKSMFVDEDLYWTTKPYHVYAPDLKFPHLHHSIGKNKDDETYRRSAANWNQGKEVFNRRKREGFPI